MLIDVHADEGPPLPGKSTEAARGFLQDHFSQSALDLLRKLYVLRSDFEGLLWVVLDLDAGFVFFEVLGGTEGFGEAFVAKILPAIGRALQGRAIGDRLADNQKKSVSAFAIVAHLCLTSDGRAGSSGMARRLATMKAISPGFHAALATALLQELLDARDALTLGVADALADVTASERHSTRRAAAWSSLVAK